MMGVWSLFLLVIIKVIITENCSRWKNLFAQTTSIKSSFSKPQNKIFCCNSKPLKLSGKPSVSTKVLFYPALSKFGQKEPRDKTITCYRHYSTKKLLHLPNHIGLAAARCFRKTSRWEEPVSRAQTKYMT